MHYSPKSQDYEKGAIVDQAKPPSLANGKASYNANRLKKVK